MTLRFDLPAPGDDAVPVFSTAKSCGEWLAALPMSNVATAQAQLRSQISLLPVAGFKPGLLFDLAESMRTTVVAVQAEMARKFVFRPLPLVEMEAAALNSALGLWRSFCLVYQMCIQSILDGERDLKGQTAMVCQRALDAQARLIFDAMCAGNEVAAADWLMLHKLYRAAEEVGVAAEKVKDSLLQGVGATHCMATYARPLLLGLGLPAEVPQRMIAAVIFWTERLANRAVITSLPPPKPVKPPVLVDTNAGRGGYRPENGAAATGGPGMRYIDIGGITVALKKRIHLLRKGESPASLGLGDASGIVGVDQTLIQLYKHWGDGRVGRELPRRVATAKAMAVAGMAAIHYVVSGKPFRQPGFAPELSTRQMREIATFGRQPFRDDDAGSVQGFALEEWALLDENVAGLRMMRSVAQPGARVTAGTLVAIKPADARAFMIGVVRWAQVQASGNLVVGIKAMPGAPVPVAVRIHGDGDRAEKYQPGLLLPAVPVLQSPPTMLLPAGWFKAGRDIDCQVDQQPGTMRLEAVVESLVDVERCTYAGVAT